VDDLSVVVRTGACDHGAVSRRTEALEAPAALVAKQLRDFGHAGLASRITEWLPREVSGDDHLHRLRTALEFVAARRDVPPNVRDEAARLVAVSTSLPDAIGRRGTVFVAWLGPPRRPRFAGQDFDHYDAYWDESPDGDGFLEQGPAFADLAAVLRWARARTNRIYVRPHWDRDATYWAGDTALRPSGLPPLTPPAGIDI
jgi:hypothetical protein